MNQQNPKKRILIIEDEQLIGELFRDYLSPEKTWNVELVGTGEEGLKKMRATKPDILLLDIILPGISGYEVLQQMKAERELEEMKEEIAKGLSLGAEDFLVKANIEIDEIQNKIKKILGKGRAVK